MDSNLEIIDEHLNSYFKEMALLKQDLPEAIPVIEKIEALRKIQDETSMRHTAADIVTGLGDSLTKTFITSHQALALASLIEVTANLLAIRIQIVDAVDELEGRPHVFH